MSLFPEPWGNGMLQGLVETTAPTAISWWPQTLGWKILFGFLAVFLLLKTYSAWCTYKKNSYRREALKWLGQLSNSSLEYSEKKALYRQLPALLRKTAIIAYGRECVVPLSGGGWEQWLDGQCKQTNISKDYPKLLSQLAFSPVISIEEKKLQELLNQVSLWVKYHRGQDD